MAETGALIDALVQKPLQYLHVSLWEFDKKSDAAAIRRKPVAVHPRPHQRQAAPYRRGQPVYRR